MNIIEELEREQIAKRTAKSEVPSFAPGDTLRIHVKIVEGERVRIQIFVIRLIAERTGVLPRNLIFVQVIHKKTPYIHGSRYRVTVFDRNELRGNVIGVELSFGFLEEPNVERALEDLARHQEIDLPSDPRQWIVHVMQENFLPARKSSLFKRLRLKLFLFLRQVSRPAYSYYGVGDAVQLTVEVIPVRLR